ncbi:MAG TPA: hypothetical protein VMV08_10505 [Gaiellaceae bacterium]|nr:hypothetical protein [Gaiellaceae bacterium]
MVTVSCDCCRLAAFEARCAAVSPLCAAANVLCATARLAWADWSVFCALVGSIFASTWPALTWAPTATSTAVSVPPVPKLADAVLATPTLPEALTLD